MSDEAAQSFRQRIAEDAALRDRIRTACLNQDNFDLTAVGRELGYPITRIHMLRLWAELASCGELNDFEIKLHTKIKHYPDARGFAWMNHELAKNMTPAPAQITVAVDPDAVAVAVITAPRKPATLDSTLASLRRGGFSQEIYVFAEPKTMRAGWQFPQTRLHQNPQRLGLYPNWINAVRWLLAETDKPFILLCEDDVEFSASAAAGLWHGLTTLDAVGYVSLYTSVRATELGEATLVPGWAAINLGRLNWGALAYGFPRDVLAEIVRREVNPEQESTDSYVAEHLRQMGLNCWHHLPSLARHTGNENSSVGHPSRTGYTALGYHEAYLGFRDTRSPSPLADREGATGGWHSVVPQIPAELPGELWGLIAYYNPAGYTNKFQNLSASVRRARSQGLKLLIVELAFGDAPFEVPDDLSDVVVRRRTNSVLWQKERLLNLGLQQLPASCDKVVWLDGDLLFENDAWVAETSKLLQSFMAIQPFDTACWLPQGEEWLPVEAFGFGNAEGRAMPGIAYVMAGLSDPRDLLPDYYQQGHTGFAWAARRQVLEKHGFHDVQILGGGDFTMAHAMFGIEEFFDGSRRQSERYSSAVREHIAEWSRGFHADVRASVSFVPGRVLHLWHGNLADRKYIDRHSILRTHEFDPKADLVLDDNGCWTWATDKSGLIEQVAQYFVDRNEGTRNA